MAYPVRLFHEGYWYHVYTRGQRREPLFFAPIDRIAYLSFLDRELSRRAGVIGSYCLMTNHVHLLIRMGTVELGDIFRSVHMKYAKYFNTRRDTTGHVFQGRPGMKIILDDAYLRTLVGYIHENPVESGMVSAADEYEYSSWRWFLSGFKEDLANAVYPPGFEGNDRAQMFRDVIEEDVDLPKGENYWGTKEEWEQMDRREEGREGRKYRERRDKPSKPSITNEVIEGEPVTIEDLKSTTQKQPVTQLRREAMARMYEEGYGPTEIGKYFNQTPGSVNNAWNRWNEQQ